LATLFIPAGDAQLNIVQQADHPLNVQYLSTREPSTHAGRHQQNIWKHCCVPHEGGKESHTRRLKRDEDINIKKYNWIMPASLQREDGRMTQLPVEDITITHRVPICV
jgi:hypothetical protein